MNKVKPSFVVDLSMTMILDYNNSNNNGSENDKQRLFCNCGSSQTYSQKIVRNVVTNYDELTEDGESISSITCIKCKKEYNKDNKLYLLSVDVEELYSVEYESKEDNNTITINKKKNFVSYSKSKDLINYKQIIDVIVLDKKTKQLSININEPFYSEYIKDKKTDLIKDKKVKCQINLTNVSILEEFFHYKSSINYYGLNECSKILNFYKTITKDFKKFNNEIQFINYIFLENRKMEEVYEGENINYFQDVESGFGDGKIIRKEVIVGDYLINILSCHKLLTSISSYESSSTIILTKGYSFFKKWIESDFVCNPDVYEGQRATNPNRIMETSLKFNKNGQIRTSIPGCKNDIYSFKMSSTIYNSLRNVDDLNIISKTYSLEILKKNEIEELIQKYSTSKVYNLLNQILSKNYNNDINLSYKNIEHILKNSFEKVKNLNSYSNDFLTIYLDTIRVIDLLGLKEKTIFKCKDFISLKEMHDDYSARFNSMKDIKKAELYSSSVKEFLGLNCTIGDVEFEVVSTSERLNLEGLKMQHCIYTYLNRICEKRYLAINATHLITKEMATAGFVRNGSKLNLEQLKGFYNSRATEEMIMCVIEFCNKKDCIKMGNSIYDLKIEKSRQRAAPNQMSEEDLYELRKISGEIDKTHKNEIKDKNSLSLKKSFLKILKKDL